MGRERAGKWGRDWQQEEREGTRERGRANGGGRKAGVEAKAGKERKQERDASVGEGAKAVGRERGRRESGKGKSGALGAGRDRPLRPHPPAAPRPVHSTPFPPPLFPGSHEPLSPPSPTTLPPPNHPPTLPLYSQLFYYTAFLSLYWMVSKSY